MWLKFPIFVSSTNFEIKLKGGKFEEKGDVVVWEWLRVGGNEGRVDDGLREMELD